MTAAIDAGRIVRQASFAIAPDETAFSLNARCYEAGLATFVAIVQDLARDELALTPQQGSRSYFGRACVPSRWPPWICPIRRRSWRRWCVR